MARLVGAGIAATSAVFAACFSTPPPPSAGDDARRDGNGGSALDATDDGTFASIDASPGSCKTDDFSSSGSGATCGSSGWATPNVAAGSAYTNGGDLVLQLFGSSTAFARCVGGTGAWSRFTVNVVSAGQDPWGGQTFVGLVSGDARFGILFTWDDLNGAKGMEPLCGVGSTQSAGPIQFDVRFVQIARAPAGSVKIGVSVDGMSYREVGSCTPTAGILDNAYAELALAPGTGSNAGLSSSFDSIELCT